MKKLKCISLFLAFPLLISCSQLKTAVEILGEKNAVKSKSVIADVPRNIKNSSPDKHAREETAIIVSRVGSGPVYVGEDLYPREEIGETIKRLLDKHPSERQMIYLNASANVSYGDLVETFDIIRRTEVERIGLLVEPSVKSDERFNVLKINLPAEPAPEDVVDTNMQIIELQKDGKIKLARHNSSYERIYEKGETKEEELSGKVASLFKEREEKKVYRPGTSELDKSVYIRATRSNRYVEVVRLVDALQGAGASPIYLQLDDLEM